MAGASLLALAVVALVVELVLVTFGSAFGDVTARDYVVVTAMSAAAAATLLTGISRPAGTRAPWILLGCGSLAYAGGSIVLFFLQKTLTTFPSSSDLLWLGFYPFVAATIVLLVRQQRRGGRLGISLDAAIIALALGALAFDLIFTGVINVGTASEVVGGQLSYSVLDFTILAMLVLICAPSRSRLGRAYIALGAGLLIFLASDVLVVREVSAGTYAPGTLLDAGWPAGMVLFALASRLDSPLKRVGALRGRSLYAGIALPFCVAFGLLIEEGLNNRNPVVLVLAALVPCLIVMRLIASMRENERLARDNEGIISAAGEGIFRTDQRGLITFANPAAESMLGYEAGEMLGKGAHRLVHHTRANGARYPAADCPAGKTLTQGISQRITDERYWRKDGSSFSVDYTCAPIRGAGRIVGSVTVFDDVTRQSNLKEQLRHQADHDSLTGLYNRRRFGRDVSSQLSYAQRYSHPGALLLLDLDTFKFVNDSYGHPRGDRLLCDVAAVLSATVGETDVVARIGGDEFAVLLREAGPEDARQVAKELITAIKAGSDPTVGASVGIAPFSGSEERTPDELLVAADVALYQAKEEGGSTAAVYSGQNGQALTWVERIREALAKDRLVVYAQPIVDLGSGRVAREELLVRMLDADGDTIPPITFLPTAERFGLIAEIDLLVLARGIELVTEGASVAINVSPRTLTDRRYLATLERALARNLPPDHFNFEVTETAAVANMGEAQEFARRVRELGCTLSLDDFGTGFSSFTYLKHIPAQYLKIDIEFIRELRRSSADQQLVAAIVSIARALGLKTVAEGVEDEQTLELVRSLGVDYAQGFHVGLPAATEGPPPGVAATRPSKLPALKL